MRESTRSHVLLADSGSTLSVLGGQNTNRIQDSLYSVAISRLLITRCRPPLTEAYPISGTDKVAG